MKVTHPIFGRKPYRSRRAQSRSPCHSDGLKSELEAEEQQNIRLISSTSVVVFLQQRVLRILDQFTDSVKSTE